MRNLHNIEKSAFHRGQYVGYANGVWRIDRHAGKWRAIKGIRDIRADTLTEISALLEKEPQS